MTIWNIVCLVLTAITSYVGWCVICFVIVATITDYVERKKKRDDCEKYVIKQNNDEQGFRAVMEDGQVIEIKYGEKNLIKGNCTHCSDSVDYTYAGCEVLYACPLPKCKFEEDNKITIEIIGEKNECKNS